MEFDLATLAASLDDVARGVPGVSALYSSSPAIVTSVRQIGSGAEKVQLVSVRKGAEAYEIVANIGVASTVQGPQTAAAVSAALLAALPADMAARVHVRVSRILGR